MFVAVVPPDRRAGGPGGFLAPAAGGRAGLPVDRARAVAPDPGVHGRRRRPAPRRPARPAGAGRRPSYAVRGDRSPAAAPSPNPARAKVLYAGVETDGDGARPAGHGGPGAAAKAGAAVDGGRFHPHVTLARTGRPVEATRWLRVLDAYRGPDLAGRGGRAGRLPPRRGARAGGPATRWSTPSRSAGPAPAPDGNTEPETGPWQGVPRARLPDRPDPRQGRPAPRPAVGRPDPRRARSATGCSAWSTAPAAGCCAPWRTPR